MHKQLCSGVVVSDLPSRRRRALRRSAPILFLCGSLLVAVPQPGASASTTGKPTPVSFLSDTEIPAVPGDRSGLQFGPVPKGKDGPSTDRMCDTCYPGGEPGGGCNETISRNVSRAGTADDPYSHVTYDGHLTCQNVPLIASGRALVVDRTPEREGTIWSIGSSLTGNNSHSTGSVNLFDMDQPGGGRVEVALEMRLEAPPDRPWTACNPAPGLRYLRCDGLNTNVLYVTLGTNSFSTNMCVLGPDPGEPPVPDSPSPNGSLPEQATADFDCATSTEALPTTAGKAGTESATAGIFNVHCDFVSVKPVREGGVVRAYADVTCDGRVLALKMTAVLWKRLSFPPTLDQPWQRATEVVGVDRYFAKTARATVATDCTANDTVYYDYAITAALLAIPLPLYRPYNRVRVTWNLTLGVLC
jgi:hypothetical protein